MLHNAKFADQRNREAIISKDNLTKRNNILMDLLFF
jgi:hypothetical protein